MDLVPTQHPEFLLAINTLMIVKIFKLAKAINLSNAMTGLSSDAKATTPGPIDSSSQFHAFIAFTSLANEAQWDRAEAIRIYREAGVRSVAAMHLSPSRKLELPASVEHLQIMYLRLEIAIMRRVFGSKRVNPDLYARSVEYWNRVARKPRVVPYQQEGWLTECVGVQKDVVETLGHMLRNAVNGHNHVTLEGFMKAMLVDAENNRERSRGMAFDKEPVRVGDDLEERISEDKEQIITNLSWRVLDRINVCMVFRVDVEDIQVWPDVSPKYGM